MNTLAYDGIKVTWGKEMFRATSGKRGYQLPENQCIPDHGPVPEGNYYIPLIEGSYAEDDGTGLCKLIPSWRIEKIPRGEMAGDCESNWANWGNNRVRFEPNDDATKAKCNPYRSGFYLHDSIKGFSSGCIEIEQHFFDALRTYIKSSTGKKLFLNINYTVGSTTYGGTDK